LFEDIRTKKKIDDEIKAELTKVLDEFKTTFEVK